MTNEAVPAWTDVNALINHVSKTNKDKVAKIGYRTKDRKIFTIVLERKPIERKKPVTEEANAPVDETQQQAAIPVIDKLMLHDISENVCLTSLDVSKPIQKVIDRWLAGEEIEHIERHIAYQVTKERLDEVFSDMEDNPFVKYKKEYLGYFYRMFHHYGHRFGAVCDAFYVLTRSAVCRTRGEKGMYLTYLGGAPNIYLEGFNKAFGLKYQDNVPRTQVRSNYYIEEIMRQLGIHIDTLGMVLKINELHKQFTDRLVFHYHPEEGKVINVTHRDILKSEVPEVMKANQEEAIRLDEKAKRVSQIGVEQKAAPRAATSIQKKEPKQKKPKKAGPPVDLKALDVADLAASMMSFGK